LAPTRAAQRVLSLRLAPVGRCPGETSGQHPARRHRCRQMGP